MVYLFLADGFEELEAIGTLDVFRRAGVSIKTVGVTGKAVTSAHQLTLMADMGMDDAFDSDWEMLVLPGGLTGVANLEQNAVLAQMLRTAFANNVPVAAICAAPTMLARMGLLKGRKATCFPSLADALVSGGAEVCTDTPWVKEGNLVTGRGVGACITFALAALSLIRGESIVAKTAKAMQTPL